MTPVSSRSRTRRWQAEAERPTAAARSALLIRPSVRRTWMMRRSIPSTTPLAETTKIPQRIARKSLSCNDPRLFAGIFDDPSYSVAASRKRVAMGVVDRAMHRIGEEAALAGAVLTVDLSAIAANYRFL